MFLCFAEQEEDTKAMLVHFSVQGETTTTEMEGTQCYGVISGMESDGHDGMNCSSR
jgi:hypothetical protein